MSTALIVGVASQDGSYLAEFLLAKNYTVIGTTRAAGDDLTYLSPLASRLTLATADLADPPGLADLVRKYHPDEIYNLAAMSVPIASWDKAYLTGQITGLGPVALLEAVRHHSPQSRFFQATSREIFGPVASHIATEQTPIHPENPYAAAKAYAHFMTRIYRQYNHLFAVSGLLFNHESPRRPLSFVTRKITRAAASKQRVHLWDLDSPRDRGFAKEYVEAMWLMLQNKQPKDYVIATGDTHTIAEICNIAYSRVGLNYKDYVVLDPPPVPVSADSVRGDNSAIRNDLGWFPKTGFKQLIELMVDSDLEKNLD